MQDQLPILLNRLYFSTDQITLPKQGGHLKGILVSSNPLHTLGQIDPTERELGTFTRSQIHLPPRRSDRRNPSHHQIPDLTLVLMRSDWHHTDEFVHAFHRPYHRRQQPLWLLLHRHMFVMSVIVGVFLSTAAGIVFHHVVAIPSPLSPKNVRFVDHVFRIRPVTFQKSSLSLGRGRANHLSWDDQLSRIRRHSVSLPWIIGDNHSKVN
jgi:hypothetical protein